jgi:hypothetical protein
LSWPASIALFVVPLLLVVATLVFQRTSSPPVLAVEITDRYSGGPIAGAEIVAGSTSVVSDAAGLATLEAANPPIRVEIRADGYEPVMAEVDPAGAERWPVAMRPARLAGAVVDERTKDPIAGVRVAAIGVDGTGPETTSAADGTYRLDGVPADARLVVEAGDYGVIEQTLAQQTRLDFSLKRSGRQRIRAGHGGSTGLGGTSERSRWLRDDGHRSRWKLSTARCDRVRGPGGGLRIRRDDDFGARVRARGCCPRG